MSDKQLRDALQSIKNMVCGERSPCWTNDWATTRTRMRIADIVDIALSAAPQCEDGALVMPAPKVTHTRGRVVNTGVRPPLVIEPDSQCEDDRRDKERLDWIIDNAVTNGGGNGFMLEVWIPHDSEDVRTAIDAAMESGE